MGFKLAKIEEIQATGAFYAEIQRDGKTVGEVSDDGRGGMYRHHFMDRSLETAYMSEGQGVLADATTDADGFTNYLLAVAEVNRRRNVCAIRSMREFIEAGTYVTFKNGTVAQIKQHRPDLLVWDKVAYAFV